MLGRAALSRAAARSQLWQRSLKLYQGHCGSLGASSSLRAATPSSRHFATINVVTSSAGELQMGQQEGMGTKASAAASSSSKLPADVPSFKAFMRQQQQGTEGGHTHSSGKLQTEAEGKHYLDTVIKAESQSLASEASASSGTGPSGPTVFIETYGCQQNASDTEIILSILAAHGMQPSPSMEEADILLTNTCAIRDNAEAKVWNKLDAFRKQKRTRSKASTGYKPVIGVLGCMAERLKTKLLESDKLVDLVVGPDSYRDLPRLISMIRGGQLEQGLSVQLSQDETYAEVAPLREGSNRVTAFLSIMRGCNNMCSFCIVPHTRGRERSRDVGSIVAEVQQLWEQGFREVTLLGQNVNSYHDKATAAEGKYAGLGYRTAEGFSNMYKSRQGDGVRFAELLDRLSLAAPDMRLRFTSPHPKDFPDEVLQLLKERPNICRQVHLPAQSGSTAVLSSMRRGYTREAYLSLAERMREEVPGLALSSDFISGFCGETQEDHLQTLSLIERVQYEQAFLFAYSRRERTHAAYHLQDDVPEEEKQRRLSEVISAFRTGAAARNAKELGQLHVVLVEGASKRSKQMMQRAKAAAAARALQDVGAGAEAEGAAAAASSAGEGGELSWEEARAGAAAGNTSAAAATGGKKERSNKSGTGTSTGTGTTSTSSSSAGDLTAFLSSSDELFLQGRSDNNKRVVFPARPLHGTLSAASCKAFLQAGLPLSSLTSAVAVQQQLQQQKRTASAPVAAPVQAWFAGEQLVLSKPDGTVLDGYRSPAALSALAGSSVTASSSDASAGASSAASGSSSSAAASGSSSSAAASGRVPEKGTYVLVRIVETGVQTLQAVPLAYVDSLSAGHMLLQQLQWNAKQA